MQEYLQKFEKEGLNNYPHNNSLSILITRLHYQFVKVKKQAKPECAQKWAGL